jgi:hypothetical protein
MQHFLKSPRGAARAKVFAAELFQKFYIPVYEADAAPDTGFRWERLAALAHRLKRRGACLG